MAQVDFYSMLSGLGDTLAANRKEAARREAFSAINNPDGTVDFNKAILGLTRVGDLEGAARIQQLAGSMEDRRFRREESARSQGNADRSFGLQERQFNAGIEGQKMPPGFERAPTGGLRPVAGGPSDPAYIQSATDAKDKGRQFSVTDVTKLSEEARKFSDLSGFATTFKPDYAGYKNPAVGSAVNYAGRYLPEGVVGKNVAEGATWWQGYDRYKNVVRNELFGSALTATEKAAFEAADINSGMTPDRITKNLARQQQVVRNGLVRKANALIQSGYSPEAIGSAYGLPLSEIGVTATKRGRAVGGAATGTPSAGITKEQYDALQPGSPYTAPDGSQRVKQ
jgi:hypothetical protein